MIYVGRRQGFVEREKPDFISAVRLRIELIDTPNKFHTTESLGKSVQFWHRCLVFCPQLVYLLRTLHRLAVFGEVGIKLFAVLHVLNFISHFAARFYFLY